MKIITQKIGALEYLTAENIPVPHCFTTRLGGVSQGYLSSLNLGIHRGDDPKNVEENYRILGSAIGFSPEDVVAPRQIHSDIVVKVGREDREKYMQDGASYECDALITNEPGIALVVFTADCTPILFYDPVTGAVGAAHAGWRGTAAGIAAKTVRAMQEHFGTKPETLCCAIGPNIGKCCFETDADVPQAMIAALGEQAVPYIRQEKNKYFLDLKQINALFLKNSGVTNIAISEECTVCRSDRYWSHRVVGKQRGSQGAVIVRREEEG